MSEKDVIPGSSPADGSEGEGQQSGRTVDNVRGELMRKLEDERKANQEFQQEMMQQFAGISKQFGDLISSMKDVATPASKTVDPSNPDSYSVEQLEQYRSQIPEENLAAYDSYLAKRRNAETQNSVRNIVHSEFQTLTAAQQLDQERQRFNRLAEDRYPDLKNPTSELAREVAARLKDTPAKLIEEDPKALFNAANEVAIERDVKPQVRRIVTGHVAGGSTAPVENPGVDEYINTDEEREAIAKALERALPPGQKFDMEQIKEREKELKKNLHLYVNRKVS